MNKRSDTDVRTNDTAEMQALHAAAVAAPPAVKKSDDEKMHIFWRVFGGALLSVAAFAGFTLYNTLTNSIAELRGEVSRLNEVKAEAAKKLKSQGGEFFIGTWSAAEIVFAQIPGVSRFGR